jgi:hypothetical protein
LSVVASRVACVAGNSRIFAENLANRASQIPFSLQIMIPSWRASGHGQEGLGHRLVRFGPLIDWASSMGDAAPPIRKLLASHRCRRA